jgi:hypothetical protein
VKWIREIRPADEDADDRHGWLCVAIDAYSNEYDETLSLDPPICFGAAT